MSLNAAFGAAIAVALVALAPLSASAVSVSFERITSNSSADASSQLTLDVTDGGSGALFDFGVLTGANPGANVAEIYFSDTSSIFSTPLLQSGVVTQVGVDFTVGAANPPDLPGGNNASPAFSVTPGLLADALGANANGLTVGDDLVLQLTYQSGAVFDDLLSALNSGDFRVGLHVRSLLDDQSDSFVSTPPDVGQIPLPATLPLLFAALGGIAFVTRRKRS